MRCRQLKGAAAPRTPPVSALFPLPDTRYASLALPVSYKIFYAGWNSAVKQPDGAFRAFW
jgi:hypothetical protein